MPTLTSTSSSKTTTMSDSFARITFPPEQDEFYADLRKEVSAHFKNAGHTHFGNRQIHVKVAVMFAVYFGLYACMLSASPSVEMLLVWYALIGVCLLYTSPSPRDA